jgi:hypothetical protein
LPLGPAEQPVNASDGSIAIAASASAARYDFIRSAAAFVTANAPSSLL